MPRCICCNEEFEDEDLREEEVYDPERRRRIDALICEVCVDEHYCVCEECGCLVRGSTNDDDLCPICAGTTTGTHPDGAPANPPVNKTQRDEILSLHREFLTKKEKVIKPKYLIQLLYQESDQSLAKVRTVIPYCGMPLSLIPLKTPDMTSRTYHWRCNASLKAKLDEALKTVFGESSEFYQNTVNSKKVKAFESYDGSDYGVQGQNYIAISYPLRTKHVDEVIAVLRLVLEVKEEAVCAE